MRRAVKQLESLHFRSHRPLQKHFSQPL